MIFFILFLCVLPAVICYYIAKGNGRSTNKSIVMGLLFGFFAVIAYAMMGKSFEKKLAEAQALAAAAKGN